MSFFRVALGIALLSFSSHGESDATSRLRGAQMGTRAARDAGRQRVIGLIDQRRQLQQRAYDLARQAGTIQNPSAQQLIQIGLERDKVLKQIRDLDAQIQKEIDQLRALGETEAANELALKARNNGAGTDGKPSGPPPAWAVAMAAAGLGAGIAVAATAGSGIKAPPINTRVTPAAPSVSGTSMTALQAGTASPQIARIDSVLTYPRPRPSVPRRVAGTTGASGATVETVLRALPPVSRRP